MCIIYNQISTNTPSSPSNKTETFFHQSRGFHQLVRNSYTSLEELTKTDTVLGKFREMSTCSFITRSVIKIFCLVQGIISVVLPAEAQDSIANRKKWNFLAEPYLMFPNLNGKVGVGKLPDTDIDADPGDVFGHLKIAAILYLEMATDKWAFTSDLVYMNLDEDATPGTIINSGNVNLKQFSWEFAGLRRVLPWLEAGIGGRINNIKTSLELVTKNIGGSTNLRSKSLSHTWLDPIIIARITSKPDKKFIYQFRGDLGGFGVGSEFAWQLQAYAGYRFSRLFQLTGGYKIISMNYQNGSDDSRLLYDVDTFGPVVRLGFNF
jgi:hypothetical protein